MSDPQRTTTEEQVPPGPGGPAPLDEAPLPEEVPFEEPAPGDEVAPGDGGLPSVEDILNDLERVTAERDEFLQLAQSKQAELENLRKRVAKQQADEVTRRTASVVRSLLPVLDAFDYGIAHGSDDLVPMRDQLLSALQREGLERLDPGGEAFDPNEHEAVAHEPGDGDGADSIVAEVLRAGYRWQGQLLRPVMVKVKG